MKEGKINFQGWSRTKGIIFQRKFKISKKKKKKKNFFKGLQKSIKVSHLKRKFKSKKKREWKITHIKIVEQQGTHHLKSNPKF